MYYPLYNYFSLPHILFFIPLLFRLIEDHNEHLFKERERKHPLYTQMINYEINKNLFHEHFTALDKSSKTEDNLPL